MNPFRKLGLPFLAALMMLGVSAAAHAAFLWPNPVLHPRVITSVDQAFEETFDTHRNWFAKDFLILSLYISDVPYGQSDGAIQQFFALRDTLRYQRILVGTYISGTTALPEFSLTKYPANAVSIEDISVKTKYLGPWLRDPVQKVVDIRDPLSRKTLLEGIHALWIHVRTPIRFIDNAAIHPQVAAAQPWDAYCDNMRDLRKLAEGMRSNAVFNVFVRPWQMSEKETRQLIDAVGPDNGVELTLPWSKTIKDDKNANGWAIYRYRQMLDAGLAIIMVPSDDAPEEDLIGWLGTWRRPSDRIYVAVPYWEEPYWIGE